MSNREDDIDVNNFKEVVLFYTAYIFILENKFVKLGNVYLKSKFNNFYQLGLYWDCNTVRAIPLTK